MESDKETAQKETKEEKNIREVKKKTHLDGLSPQWGGGFQSESTFHVFFLLLMKKLCQKIGKER